MALATKCPHCNTTFRVASDQLKLRGGIVRCGTCHQVFDGNAALVKLDAVVPPVPPATVEVEARVDTPVDAPVEAPDGIDAVDAVDPADAVETVDPVDTVDELAPAEPAVEPGAETIAAPFTETPESGTEAGQPAPSPNDSAPEDLAAPEEEHPPLPGPDYVLDYDLSEPEPEPEPEPAPVASADPAPAAIALDFDLGEDVALAVDARLPAPAADSQPAIDFDLGHDSLLDQVDPDAAPRGELSLADEEAFSSDAPDTSGTSSVLPDLETGPLPLLRESAAAPERTPEPVRAIVLPVYEEADHDEPEFVRLAREQELAARRRRLTMGGGSVLLALVLVLHGGYVFRDLLAARVPALKPTLVAACKIAGCKIALPAQIESQSIEGPDLQTLPNGNLVLTALLRNGSSLTQAWPYIELELTDADRKPLIRRVFTPKQYLPANVAVAKGFPATTEQPVKIHFELKQTKASGFNIGVFYP